MVLLMDDFGIERYYQQPLAKQFFSNLPEYDDIDIYARFALRSDYWFPGDPLSTTQNLDFTYIVLREMIHSLGFYSSWRMRFRDDNTIIVPRPYCNDGTGDCDIYGRNKDKVWIGFREHIFDKYLMNLYTGEMLTNKTSYLNKLFDSNIIHGKISKLEKGLQGSLQYEIAKEMYGLATTNGTIGFLSWSDMQFSDSLVLETNIVPFDNDINLKYIDNIYTNTSDFLMRNQWPIGITLQDQITAGGNYSNGTLYGSIGPKLRRMFETIGYATVDNPIVTQSPKIPLPLPPINAMSIGNSLTFNTLYQTYLFLIIVAYEIYF
ncbi:hypothetical protein C1645_735264 [Glomus cerebriforme]|uniref:Uncharacterized protein n=1 Tax=Glomus cerebriforme TaxID=658196 RepID=A0A397T7J9_9GLOM|nr:hypothetical protein C1645_735264 [Glomus cerebriforme]